MTRLLKYKNQKNTMLSDINYTTRKVTTGQEKFIISKFRIISSFSSIIKITQFIIIYL